MAIRLTLRAHQLKGLAAIRDLGAEGIQSIIEKFEKLQTTPLRPIEVHQVLEEILPDHKDALETVTQQLMSLYALLRQRSLDADTVLEGLQYGIDHAPEDQRWEERKLAEWRELQPQLKNLLSLRKLWLVAKALDLAYEYANLLQSARILTDIRPVFNENGDEIEGTVISHTLRLYYDNPEGIHSLSVALDKEDIEAIHENCERALRKAEAAKCLMIEKAEKPTIVSGEDEDEPL